MKNLVSDIALMTFLMSFTIFITASAQITIPPDKEQLLKGDSGNQTSIAETNGLISPQKILAMKDQLSLTKDQIKKIDEIMKNLPISATVKGQDIVEAEEGLNNMFQSGNINEKTLRTKLERIGKLRAELRFTHLQVYLKAKQILSAKQWERLKELQISEVK